MIEKNARLRIGVDIRLPDAPSGQQRYLWRLGHWLAGRGHDARLLCTVHAPEPGTVATAPTARVEDLSGLSGPALVEAIRGLELNVLLLNPERSRHYVGGGEQIRANVLRPGYGTDQYRQKLRSIRNPVSKAVRKLLRITPPVMRKRGIEEAFYRGIRRDGGDRGTGDEGPVEPEVLAISRYMEGEILDTYDVAPERVHVVPNGVDTEAFSPEARAALREEARKEFGIPADALCILCVAHNFRLKGIPQALRHVARLRAEGVPAHLLVAGRGTGKAQRLQAGRWARKAGVEAFTHMPGVVRPVMRAFAAGDVFLHLSWHDAFGFVVLEAMAAGLPPLTTPWAGASMLVEDGEAGRVVDPDDEAAVYAGLKELARTDAREEMGRRARAVAEAHSEEANFLRVEEVCRQAAARWPGPVR